MRAVVPPAEGLVLRENVPLAPRTTLRVGGCARTFAEVQTKPALVSFLRLAAAEGLPILPLGKGSNVLIPDEGWDGAAFVLAGEFLRWRMDGERVIAGGGVSLMSLAVATKTAGLSGLENLSGIPSTLGGAIRINAGAYGTEIFELLESVDVVTRAGEERTLPASEIPHGYRWSRLMDGTDIVSGGTLALLRRPSEEIEARLAAMRETRRGALPPEPNAGSIFKNPPGRFAGKLLEECGLKGTREGGAMISERHANVIVNAGGATARDVRRLMTLMQAAVRERFGLELVPEIDLVGERPPA